MWLLNSSIGKKVVMSLTGLFLILFLTFHMSMNLVAIFSEEGYNMVCEFLGANWYALAGTAVIAAGAVLHILFALWLTYINRRARGKDRYKVTENPKTWNGLLKICSSWVSSSLSVSPCTCTNSGSKCSSTKLPVSFPR